MRLNCTLREPIAFLVYIFFQLVSSELTACWNFRSFGSKIATLAIVSTLQSSTHPAMADNRLNAPSAAGTRVNSDAESLLRNGLPIQSKESREIQRSIEEIKANIKTRRISFAKGNVEDTRNLLKKYQSTILKYVEPTRKTVAEDIFRQIQSNLLPLSEALDTELKAGAGSLQEEAGITSHFTKTNRFAVYFLK